MSRLPLKDSNLGKVHGVGINDAEYCVTKHEKVGGKFKITWICPIYRCWRNLLCRCYDQKRHQKFPTYQDCYVCQEWLRFSNFKKWMDAQDWEGKHLDKDILIPGNKMYSPETCAFVSPALNSFVVDQASTRGDLPIGVCYWADRKKYRANVSNPFTKRYEYLGLFDSVDAAKAAWRKRKHELACLYADEQPDPRVASALRKRYLAIPSDGGVAA